MRWNRRTSFGLTKQVGRTTRNAQGAGRWLGCLLVLVLGLPMAGGVPSTADAVEPTEIDPAGVAAVFQKRLNRLDLDDYRGRRWELDEFKEHKLIVVAFLGTECPLAKYYALRLEQLNQEWAEKGVAVIGVMSNRQDSLKDIRSFAQRQELTFPILKDAGARLADELGAERTPEVFVFDSLRVLQYRGRIDDQYVIGFSHDKPEKEDLRDAVDELLAGKPVSDFRTEAIGCIIGRSQPSASKPSPAESSVTYGGQIGKLLSQNCVQCHRDDEVAPFALNDYEEAAGWSGMIAEVIREDRMPPWHADDSGQEFSNRRRLTEEEKQAFYDWADAGAPAGDLQDLPKLSDKVVDWQLPRDPDVVRLATQKPYSVPVDGQVRYQYTVAEVNAENDIWFNAAEILPGDRRVVHHILAFAVPHGKRPNLDPARGFLVGYVPGARVDPWPQGHAKRIPAGHDLLFQIHYTPIGVATKDQSRIGFCTVDETEVTHEIVTTSAYQERGLKLEREKANQEITAFSLPMPAEAKLLSMSPHMHVRGSAFEYQLEQKGVDNKDWPVLLNVPKYDFNWQTNYMLAEPLPLQEGSRIFCTATYDNSKDNPYLREADWESEVKWGDQTDDEMMIGYFYYSVPRGKALDAATRQRLMLFGRFDRDGDGTLRRSEVPQPGRSFFDSLDLNSDGTLTRQEVIKGE